MIYIILENSTRDNILISNYINELIMLVQGKPINFYSENEKNASLRFAKSGRYLFIKGGP